MEFETINYYVALATIAAQIVTVGFLAVLFLRKRFPDLDDVADFLSQWGLVLGLLVSAGAVGMSLFYSEVLGISACGWCWVQRIFIYSQVPLFALALWKRDRKVADYSIALSAVGLIVALYQHYLQMGGGSLLPCPTTTAEALDCGVRFLFEFGYITFPLMSATIFAFLIVLMLFVRRRD